MPNIVNQSFFVREINLPNTTKTEVIEKITSYINKYEPQCLLKILGYPLFKLFGTENSQRMTDILDGAEYTDQYGELQKWQGLVHDTDISLIANYVYFYIQQSNAAQQTGVATVANKAEAGSAISPAEKMVSAWNFFSTETYSLISFLWMKVDDAGVRIYPEFTQHQFLITKNLSRSMNFLGI